VLGLEGAIALYPTGNLGAWRFLKLENGALATRFHWTKLPLTVAIVEKIEHWTQVDQSGEYNTNLHEELDSQEVEMMDTSTGGSHEIDPIVEENQYDPVQTIPEVIRNEPVIPDSDLNVEVEVDPIVRVRNNTVSTATASTRTRRSINRPARFRDPEFETNFDNQMDDVPDTHVDVQQLNNGVNINDLVNDIVNRQEAINDEVNESLEIMLAVVDPRENAFNMSIKKALEKWSDKAASAIRDELTQMIDKQVWTAVQKSSIPRGNKIIPSFMFLKEKYLSSGDLERIKARLVAGGHIQDLSPYSDTSSPTADLTSVFIVYTIAAHEKRKVVTVDVKGAYLNADIKEKVFMRISKDMVDILLKTDKGRELYGAFVDSDGCLYVQLDKALYGCVESAQLWFLELKSFMESQGFIQNPADACLYNKMVNG
jgi:hypothetical protein